MADQRGGDISADVIVVGGGPAGASVARHLATRGIDVAVLEKAEFPRDKICGDGLTPAAVHELIQLGIDTSGWARNRGLTVIGGGHRIQMEWPEQKTLPDYGMTRARMDLDKDLIDHAVAGGARLYENHTVTGAIKDAAGRITGVTAKTADGEIEARGKFVVECGGVAARLATSLGIEKNAKRPLGVAARTYFTSPRGNEEWMESHLELWDGKPGESALLPGYGWIFPMGDGTVNVGLGTVSSNAASAKLPFREVFAKWMANVPEEWGFTPENQIGTLRSAALPMSFNRKPHYSRGLVVCGDAGGMVSPFNGEGIAPALKAGRFAADAMADALSRQTVAGADRAMQTYMERLEKEYGGYYQLGRIFVKCIENPKIMAACTNYGLPRRRLMKLVHKLLSDGYERTGGDFDDHLIAMLARVVPAA